MLLLERMVCLESNYTEKAVLGGESQPDFLRV